MNDLEDSIIHVQGENAKHHIMVYALSTCGWCKKTKELMKSLDLAYNYIDVDELDSASRDKAIDQIATCNPSRSFPTIMIDEGKSCIIGFKQDEIEALV